MAHFDLNEQEQIATIKYFWGTWGKYIVALIGLAITALLANAAYAWYQDKQAQQAALVYADFTSAIHSQESALGLKLSKQLITKLPNTTYAALAAMQVAKIAFEHKDYPQANKHLTWVKDNAKDKSLRALAILRLASVATDQGDFIKARELLRTKHDLAFDGLFYEGRGDVYLAMGELARARDAYTEGLRKAANDPSTQQDIQMKLDVIGD
jgi:predicted negative regulator of RcsB-dependent stress response